MLLSNEVKGRPTEAGRRGEFMRISLQRAEMGLADQTGVSQDAKYVVQCASQDAYYLGDRIIRQMWCILVVLPFVLGLLFAILK
jgi:hypothetical protein